MAKTSCSNDIMKVKNMSKKSKMKAETPSTLKKRTENKHYIFMLVGKTGSGRSATGNSILAENYFVTSDTGSTTTSKTFTKSTLRDQSKVTVIDTPGIMDNSLSSKRAKSNTCDELHTVMTECPEDGKLIIVLVLKYGERFTEENRQTLYILKNIFGDENLWKSCIIILTHGDVFNINNEAIITFEGWTESQKDDLGKMFKDCSYRCLLYNNKTKNQEVGKQQFEKLIEFSDHIDQGYAMTTFLDSEAIRRRQRLVFEDILPETKKHIDTKIKEWIFLTNTISKRDDMYDAFNKIVNVIRNELNKLDNHTLLYYEDGEVQFLEEQREDLKFLQEDVNMRVTLNDIKNELQKVELELKMIKISNPDWISGVKGSIEQVEKRVNSETKFHKYKNKIDLFRQQLKALELELKRRNTSYRYSLKIKKLDLEIDALPASTGLNVLLNYFTQADRLATEISELEKEMGHLQCNPRTLKKKIQSKIQGGPRINFRKMFTILCSVFVVLRLVYIVYHAPHVIDCINHIPSFSFCNIYKCFPNQPSHFHRICDENTN